ncbi:flagellar protein FlaG [Bacillus salacetis]|uniref:Flagellar protein FlaG n=1 Tax=Bacillus salacetis TaxID=2315464 RepID=A0A3A1RAW9_9BACI|nr:flagellar protein FlaG [Bacillus salacetis]RIW39054.1 flagellar protein FlaG [Bacillus salacetis]
MIDKVTGSATAFSIPNQETPRTGSIHKTNQVQDELPHAIPQDPVTREKVEEVINSTNEFLEASNTSIQFQFHEKLKEYYVTIVDNKTNEVVREIPAKKMLDMYAEMTEFIGLMVDKKI